MSKEKITLTGGSKSFTVGQIDYSVLINLKALQGEKEAYFNATEVIKQYNKFYGTKKRLSDFIKRERTTELVEKLETANAVTRNDLIISKRGRNAETYIHKDLFLSLMIWLDAEHELAVTQFVNSVVNELTTVELMRTETKVLHKPMTYQIQRLQQMLKDEGSGFAPHTFTNIQKWIHKYTLGKLGHNLDELDSNEEIMLAQTRKEVEEYIEELINANVLTGREIKDRVKSLLKN